MRLQYLPSNNKLVLLLLILLVSHSFPYSYIASAAVTVNNNSHIFYPFRNTFRHKKFAHNSDAPPNPSTSSPLKLPWYKRLFKKSKTQGNKRAANIRKSALPKITDKPILGNSDKTIGIDEDDRLSLPLHIYKSGKLKSWDFGKNRLVETEVSGLSGDIDYFADSGDEGYRINTFLKPVYDRLGSVEVRPVSLIEITHNDFRRVGNLVVPIRTPEKYLDEDVGYIKSWKISPSGGKIYVNYVSDHSSLSSKSSSPQSPSQLPRSFHPPSLIAVDSKETKAENTVYTVSSKTSEFPFNTIYRQISREHVAPYTFKPLHVYKASIENSFIDQILAIRLKKRDMKRLASSSSRISRIDRSDPTSWKLTVNLYKRRKPSSFIQPASPASSSYLQLSASPLKRRRNAMQIIIPFPGLGTSINDKEIVNQFLRTATNSNRGRSISSDGTISSHSRTLSFKPCVIVQLEYNIQGSKNKRDRTYDNFFLTQSKEL